MVNLPEKQAVSDRRDATSNIIRGLGCHESYHMAMGVLGQYRGTLLACRYYPPAGLTGPENTESLKGRFYKAVVRVVLAQPHLQTGVVGETSKKPKFTRLERIELGKHIKWVQLDDSKDVEALYLETLTADLDAKFEDIATQPGWRIIVLHEPRSGRMDVIYDWDHSRHDGMSGKMFHEHLLRNLNNNKAASNKIPLRNAEDDPGQWVIDLPGFSDKLPPPAEAILPFPCSVSTLVKDIWREAKPPALFPPGDAYAKWAPIKTEPYKTRFRTFTIGHETVTKVIEACRQHQTTVTGLINALCLLSLSSELKEMKGFASRTPYDLRHFLPSRPSKYPWLEPKETLCNYVSVLDQEWDASLVAQIRAQLPQATAPSVEEEEGAPPVTTASQPLPADLMDLVWSIAARVRHEIKAKLALGGRNDVLAMMKLIPDWNDAMKTQAKRPRHLSWLVTNIGVLDGREGGEVGDGGTQGEIQANQNEEGQKHLQKKERAGGEIWSVRRAELVLSTEVPAQAISVAVVTVKDEQMAITCSWGDAAVDAGVGERLVGDLERWLREIGSGGS
ncbi:alcohol acetyltransferase-domain-containing protein [Apiospora sp. TS-2023a]